MGIEGNIVGSRGSRLMTDFHMPDSWYDPPDEKQCDMCDNGCHLCDPEIAKEYMADLLMQAIKDGEV